MRKLTQPVAWQLLQPRDRAYHCPSCYMNLLTYPPPLCADLCSLFLENILTLGMRKGTPTLQREQMLWSCKSFRQGYFHQKLSFAGSRSKSWSQLCVPEKWGKVTEKRTGSCLEIAREYGTMHSSSNKAQNVQSVFLPLTVPSCSFLRWIILSCQNIDRGGHLVSPGFLSFSWKRCRLWGKGALQKKGTKPSTGSISVLSAADRKDGADTLSNGSQGMGG